MLNQKTQYKTSSVQRLFVRQNCVFSAIVMQEGQPMKGFPRC